MTAIIFCNRQIVFIGFLFDADDELRRLVELLEGKIFEGHAYTSFRAESSVRFDCTKKISPSTYPAGKSAKIFYVLFLIAEPNVLAVAADFATVGRRLMLSRHVPFHSALRTFPIRKISRRQTCHGENYCRDNRRARQKFFHDLTSASWHNPWRIQDPP